MAKYRLLTNDELNSLEKDFIDYLVLNGIDADQWQKMKKENIEAANKTIDLFSDVVFEKILRQTKYLKKIEAYNIMFVKCNDGEMEMIAIRAVNKQISFLTQSTFDLNKILKKSELISGNKQYKLNRQMEIFKMIENGYEIDDGENFNKIKLLLNG